MIAKSSIVLDVKPWDDETDMSEIERCVRSIETDGLLWGVCESTLLLTYICQFSANDVTLNHFKKWIHFGFNSGVNTGVKT